MRATPSGTVDPDRVKYTVAFIVQVVARWSMKVPKNMKAVWPNVGNGLIPLAFPAVDQLTGYLVAARDGDTHALTSAIRMTQPEVRRFLRALVAPDELDDVTQDTWIRAYRALPRFRADSTGRTWLLSIARRAAADATRRRIRMRRANQQAQRVAPVGITAATDGAHALRELVSALEPQRQEAFVLTQMVGCSYAEAAEICGVPVGTIRSRVARARDQLLEQVLAARTA